MFVNSVRTIVSCRNCAELRKIFICLASELLKSSTTHNMLTKPYWQRATLVLCDITPKTQQQITDFPTHLPNCFSTGWPRTFQPARCKVNCSEGEAAPGYLVSSPRQAPPWAPRGGRTPPLRDSSNRAVAPPRDWRPASTSEPRFCLSWARPQPRPRSPRVPPGRRRARPGKAASPSLWQPSHGLPPASAASAPDWVGRSAPLPNSSRLSATPRPLLSPIGPWARL